MSEAELILDGMRKTGACVDQLAVAMGEHPLLPRTPRRKKPVAKISRRAPARGIFESLAGLFLGHTQEIPKPRYSQEQVLLRLHAKEALLNEALGQLHDLEQSVDELTKAARRTRHVRGH